jgi:NADH-quinone oxidoreductase subunit A
MLNRGLSSLQKTKFILTGLRKVVNMPVNFVSAMMFDTFFPIFVLIALVGVTALAFFVLSFIFGRKTKSAVKDEPYESGMVPTGDTRERFSVKFFMVAILFIIFDIEVIFLYPWAVIYRQLALFGLIEMAVFIAILLVGYIYILRAGALKWE